LLGACVPTPDPGLRIVFSPAPGVDPATAKAAYGGVVAELEERLGTDVEVRTTTDYAAVVEALGNGTADIARLGGMPYVQAHEQIGVVPLVREINPEGVAEYHGIIVGRPGIWEEPFTFDQLKGKTMAFPDIGSTSGYLSNVVNMKDNGVALDDLGEYGFLGSHPAVLEAVIAGSVDAGGTNDWRTNLAVGQGAGVPGRDFVILATTPPIPMNCWGVRADMAPDLMERVRDVLLNLPEEAFAGCDQVKGFVPGQDSDYDYVRALMEEGLAE
jgi:phosphonate transport system substrate-binding protein